MKIIELMQSNPKISAKAIAGEVGIAPRPDNRASKKRRRKNWPTLPSEPRAEDFEKKTVNCRAVVNSRQFESAAILTNSKKALNSLSDCSPRRCCWSTFFGWRKRKNNRLEGGVGP
ncbi:MAG: winged helix-turn-helix domain-containing protein [Deltaproteobacteria bacterium]|nr:winged helix-turn-helix domain-containing protein [Deltaproteobacteria bacterium]